MHLKPIEICSKTMKDSKPFATNRGWNLKHANGYTELLSEHYGLLDTLTTNGLNLYGEPLISSAKQTETTPEQEAVDTVQEAKEVVMPVALLSEDEVSVMGLAALREYAIELGIETRAKQEILDAITALRVAN